jgi:hypothetical protein
MEHAIAIFSSIYELFVVILCALFASGGSFTFYEKWKVVGLYLYSFVSGCPSSTPRALSNQVDAWNTVNCRVLCNLRVLYSRATLESGSTRRVTARTRESNKRFCFLETLPRKTTLDLYDSKLPQTWSPFCCSA